MATLKAGHLGKNETLRRLRKIVKQQTRGTIAARWSICLVADPDSCHFPDGITAEEERRLEMEVVELDTRPDWLSAESEWFREGMVLLLDVYENLGTISDPMYDRVSVLHVWIGTRDRDAILLWGERN